MSRGNQVLTRKRRSDEMARANMRELYLTGQAALNQHKLGNAMNIAEQMLRLNQRDHNVPHPREFADGFTDL